MKKLTGYILSLLFSLGAAGLSACSPGGGDETSYSISFSENPAMVRSSAGTHSVNISATHRWSAVSSDGWITNVTASGDDGSTLSFDFGKNDLSAPRDGAIVVTVPGSSYSRTLTVRQAAYTAGITFDPNPVGFDTDGGTQNVIVNSSAEWSVDKVSGDWIDATRKNSSSLTVTLGANFTGAPLSGSVSLKDSSSGETYTLNVTQEYDSKVFFGAKTEMGRRFAYKSGLVSSIAREEQYSIDDNVEVFKLQFVGNATGTPSAYSMFVFDITLGNDATIAATAVNDDNNSIKTTTTELTAKQIMRGQLAAMQNKRPGVTVLGGVNGDFFFGTSADDRNNLLHGIMYRGGECLKNTFDGGTVCTVFAMMKDGTARCMTQTQYAGSRNDIQEAVGARQQILTSGVTVSSDTTLEPRTAVGVSRDGKRVLLLVVDGRRDSYSIGASYAIMAKMFKAFDIWDAVNLDGGGSSTFATRKTGASGTLTADSFETLNRPTDSTGDREVVNGLAIVKTNK